MESPTRSVEMERLDGRRYLSTHFGLLTHERFPAPMGAAHPRTVGEFPIKGDAVALPPGFGYPPTKAPKLTLLKMIALVCLQMNVWLRPTRCAAAMGRVWANI